MCLSTLFNRIVSSHSKKGTLETEINASEHLFQKVIRGIIRIVLHSTN